jgi:hypothetical protein
MVSLRNWLDRLAVERRDFEHGRLGENTSKLISVRGFGPLSFYQVRDALGRKRQGSFKVMLRIANIHVPTAGHFE